MICPVSAITMSKVWDTVVTDRLSRDTMSEREIKRRPRPKERQTSSVARESRESTPQAEDPLQTPSADNESDLTNE
jgi:formate hydrogenlyase subunit 6/NADH:ubiquinone oxidoreductase subunit I